MLTDAARHGPDMLQIRGAILVGRGANGDELKQAVRDALSHVGGEGQPAILRVAFDQILQPRLVDGYFALLQPLNLVLIDVHAQNVITHFRKTGARYQAHVAGPENSNFHKCHLINCSKLGTRLIPEQRIVFHDPACCAR